MSLDCKVDRLLDGLAIRDWIELRWLARPGCATPVHHVAVVTAVGVQRQIVIGS